MNKTSDIHIFPFFSNYTGTVKFEHFNIGDDEAIIRGLHLTKEKLSKDIPLYSNGKKLEGNVYFWKTDKEIEDTFLKGLDLTEKGLGFTKCDNLSNWIYKK